jgi:hypothetical protein
MCTLNLLELNAKLSSSSREDDSLEVRDEVALESSVHVLQLHPVG